MKKSVLNGSFSSSFNSNSISNSTFNVPQKSSVASKTAGSAILTDAGKNTISTLNSEGIIKKKSVLKKIDRSFEGFKGGSSSLNSSFISNSSYTSEPQMRSINIARLNKANDNFDENTTADTQSKDLVWTYEQTWQKNESRGGRLALSVDNNKKSSLLHTLTNLEQAQKKREPRIKRSEMTETQKQLAAARKKNVQLMNHLRNIEDQIEAKYSSVKKLAAINTEYEQLFSQAREVYMERVLLKNNFSRECESFLEELKDTSISHQISIIRGNTEQYQDEQRNLEKQVQQQVDQEEKLKKETIQLQDQLQSIRQEVEKLSFEHTMQTKKKLEIEMRQNEKLVGCLKQYRQVSILNEQIGLMKKQFKTICYIANKKIKDKKVFNYESYFNTKDKKIELYFPDKLAAYVSSGSKSQQSQSQIKFSQMSSQIKSTTYKPAAFPHFQSILTNDRHPLFKDLNDKLSCELELFLKGSLYRNADAILQKLSFNSLEYDYVYNWSNSSQAKDALLDEKEQNVVFNIFDSYVDIVKKRDVSLSTTAVAPPNAIVMIGDKDRGGFQCILENIKRLLKFDNGLLKLRGISFVFHDLQKEAHLQSEKLSFEDLIEKYEIELSESFYKYSFCLECCLEISQADQEAQKLEQMSNSQRQRYEVYKKTIMIVVLSNDLPNKGQLARQIMLCMNKEKNIGQKDKIIENLEPLIRNTSKRILITEIPNMIKCNDKSADKYNLIKDIFQFQLAIESNNQK